MTTFLVCIAVGLLIAGAGYIFSLFIADVDDDAFFEKRKPYSPEWTPKNPPQRRTTDFTPL